MKNIPQLDLHGKSEEEVCEVLDRFFRDHENQEQVLVIVGKGRGVIKKKALEYLASIKYGWNYEKVRGVENTGALVVDLY